jgi:predicted phage terminase large subunit-like protein
MTEMTDEELIALLATDQVAFTQQCFHTVDPAHEYIHNWHIECIIEHLQAMERGEIRRLIINMPPRSLKSITCTVAWPAWLLGRNPSAQIITASYGHDLAVKHSVDTRLIIESAWYRKCFPDTEIAKDQNEKKKFQTTQRGHRKATSVGGSLTGEGGDFLIMDDPVKPDEALSDVVRNGTNMWIDQTFLTRENDPKTSRALLVMQRLHEDDPAGHLIEKGGWEQLILPAYFERRTIIQVNNRKWINEEDSYLQEDRMGEEELDQKLAELGMYGFVGQYLQRPTPEGGGEFQAQWLTYYNNFSRKFTPVGMNIYILYDPANTKKNQERIDPDYTAMVVVGLAPDNNYYLLDLVRDRFNPTERVNKLIELHQKWNKLSRKAPTVAIEQYGMMTDSFYIKKEQEERNYRFRIVEVKGAVKKEDRIRKLIPLFENARVYLPRQIMYDSIDGNSYELVEKFIKEELTVFPVGRHDDMLDAFARILDKDLGARFPKVGTVYLEGGQTLKDLYAEDFDENDIMTW